VSFSWVTYIIMMFQLYLCPENQNSGGTKHQHILSQCAVLVSTTV